MKNYDSYSYSNHIFVISGLSASIINADTNSYNNISGDSGVSTTTHSSQSSVKEVSSSFPTGLIFPDEFTYPFDTSQDNQQNIVDSESSSSISDSNDYSTDSGDSDDLQIQKILIIIIT